MSIENTDSERDMVKDLLCSGCVSGTDTNCGSFVFERDYESKGFHCKNYIPENFLNVKKLMETEEEIIISDLEKVLKNSNISMSIKYFSGVFNVSGVHPKKILPTFVGSDLNYCIRQFLIATNKIL